MNSEELREEWRRITDKVMEYDGVDSSQVSAFFSRLVPQAMSDGFLMVTADNDFLKKWIESHYASYIHQALRDLNGKDYTVAIEVDANQQTSAETKPQPTRAETPSRKETSEPAEKPQARIQPEPRVEPEEEKSSRASIDDDDPFSPTSLTSS